MIDFVKYNNKLSKVFGIILLSSIVVSVLLTYEISIEQQIGIKYLQHTFNQSATNFDVLNESRMIHSTQLQHELQLSKDTKHIDNLLMAINHTLAQINTKLPKQ